MARKDEVNMKKSNWDEADEIRQEADLKDLKKRLKIIENS